MLLKSLRCSSCAVGRASLSFCFAQVATVLADSSGLVIYTYDDSKVLQACAHLRKEVRRAELAAESTHFSPCTFVGHFYDTLMQL